jgi:hypothetical protein
MNRPVLLLSLVLLMGIGSTAQAVNRSNPLFGYTHLLPSPFTLPGGTLVYGTELSFGLTDFFQVGTSLIRDLYKIYNANSKLAIFDNESYALAFTLGWESFNYKDVSSQNPDLRITSYPVGVVQSFGLLPRLALILGARVDFTQVTRPTEEIEVSGLNRGTSLGSDLSWAYNPGKKSFGNVLSIGASYDVTYDLVGVGMSHHWPGFRIGVHYYPGADTRPFLPIITGGGSVQL